MPSPQSARGAGRSPGRVGGLSDEDARFCPSLGRHELCVEVERRIGDGERRMAPKRLIARLDES
jgi:hypothetical protein